MIVGLPIVSHQESMTFRVFVNKQLDQYSLVASPTIPKWVSPSEVAIEATQIESSCFVTQGEVNVGLLLLAIRPDKTAAFITTGGGCFFVGSSDCESTQGCVLLVHLSRTAHDFLGGHITLLDVLSFDGINYSMQPFKERSKILRFMTNSIRLPSRFTVSTAVYTPHLQNLNSSVIGFALLKQNP
jgi:hypothetical protein